MKRYVGAVLVALLCFGTAANAQHRNRDGTKKSTAPAVQKPAATKQLKISVQEHDGTLNKVNRDPLNTEAVHSAMNGENVDGAAAMLDREYDARIDLTRIEAGNWDEFVIGFRNLPAAQAGEQIFIVPLPQGTVIRELWSKHHVFYDIVVGIEGLTAVVVKVVNNGIPSYVGVIIGCSNGVLFDREIVEVVPSPVETAELTPEAEPVQTESVDLGGQPKAGVHGDWKFQVKVGATAGNLPRIDEHTGRSTVGSFEPRSQHVYFETMYTVRLKRGTLLDLIGDVGVDHISTSRYQDPDEEGLGARGAARLEAQLSQRIARGWWLKLRVAAAYAHGSDGPAYQGVEAGVAIDTKYVRVGFDYLNSTSPHETSADSTYKNNVVSVIVHADNLIPAVRQSTFGQKVDLGLGFQRRFGEEMRWPGRYGFDLEGNPGEFVAVAYVHMTKRTGLFLRGTSGVNRQVSYDMSGPEMVVVGDADYKHVNLAAWLNLILPW